MTWIPCSGRDSVAGLVWLPRLLEKARHCEASANSRLVDGYCYGDNDFIDKQLIAFLRTDDATISALVREQPVDNRDRLSRVHRTDDPKLAFALEGAGEQHPRGVPRAEKNRVDRLHALLPNRADTALSSLPSSNSLLTM